MYKRQLEAARAVAVAGGVQRHVVVPLDLRAFGGAALTDDIEVPKDRTGEEMESGIPVTYVPARNTIFLAVALGWAETLGATDLFVGVNAVDYSGYPDCRPEFIKAFAELANLATQVGVEGTGQFEVHSPLIAMTKAEIITPSMGLPAESTTLPLIVSALALRATREIARVARAVCAVLIIRVFSVYFL